MPKEQKDIQYPIGVEDLLICMQETPGTTTVAPTFSDVVYSQTNITDVTISNTIASLVKWASNKKIISISKNSNFGLAFNLAGLNRDVKDEIFGKKDVRGVSFENSKIKEYPKFAVGLIMPLSDGNKVVRWYPNCSITPADETFTTITEEMTVNDTAYTITADPLLHNENTLAELDTGRTNANITAEQFMEQVVYDEAQLATLFPAGTTPEQ